MSASALLAVDGVTRRFGGLRALDGCTFECERGKVTCLVGPNGAGKTTVFDVITGFLTPDLGSVRFDDATITGLSRREIVKRGIARSFQTLRLFEEMTVLDNVIVCLADESGNSPLTSMLRPIHSRAIVRRKSARAREILDTVGLSDKADHRVTEISFGQQRLLCIARVLATDARLLLLDEPTAGLGATALDNVVGVIRRLCEGGKTLLVVEHNTRIVKDIADRIVFLHQGRAMASGDPDTILGRRDLVDIYFGGAL